MLSIRDVVVRDEYKFLQENKALKDKVIFLVFGGSHSYGTNVIDSDIDIRGCALNSCSDILGLSQFEQFIDNTTDTVIYGFNKMIKLLLNCNPNIVEMLGCRPEQYIIYNSIGQELINNRKLFLSCRAAKSYKGYAFQQLKRLENSIARNAMGMTDDIKRKNNKHAMHLVRLYLTSIDLFEKGDIITYRGNDLKLLLDIRNGVYSNEDGTLRPEFFELTDNLYKQVDYALKNTVLPAVPDIKKIEEFVIAVNRRSIDG